jgi:hypothetical protein
MDKDKEAKNKDNVVEGVRRLVPMPVACKQVMMFVVQAEQKFLQKLNWKYSKQPDILLKRFGAAKKMYGDQVEKVLLVWKTPKKTQLKFIAADILINYLKYLTYLTFPYGYPQRCRRISGKRIRPMNLLELIFCAVGTQDAANVRDFHLLYCSFWCLAEIFVWEADPSHKKNDPLPENVAQCLNMCLTSMTLFPESFLVEMTELVIRLVVEWHFFDANKRPCFLWHYMMKQTENAISSDKVSALVSNPVAWILDASLTCVSYYCGCASEQGILFSTKYGIVYE